MKGCLPAGVCWLNLDIFKVYRFGMSYMQQTELLLGLLLRYNQLYDLGVI